MDNKVKIYQFRDPTQILTYQINTVSPFWYSWRSHGSTFLEIYVRYFNLEIKFSTSYNCYNLEVIKTLNRLIIHPNKFDTILKITNHDTVRVLIREFQKWRCSIMSTDTPPSPRRLDYYSFTEYSSRYHPETYNTNPS